MVDERTCSECGRGFQASPWSRGNQCPECAATAEKSPAVSLPPQSSPDENADTPRGWDFHPRTGDAEDIESVPVTEEQVPVSELGKTPVEAQPPTAGGTREIYSAALRDRRTKARTGASAEPPLPHHGGAGGRPPLFKDTGFWIVLAMGVMPLFINGIENPVYKLSGMIFFFALLWGGVFQGFVLRSTASLYLPLLAFFFTGVVGLFALLRLYALLPSAYMEMAHNGDRVVQLLGYVFQVGLCEELCKLIPVFLYLYVRRENATVEMAVLVGIFSGLGFAAFENIQYSEAMAMTAVNKVAMGGRYGGLRGALEGANLGVIQAMGVVLLRSISLVFVHAVLSGIGACLFVTGFFRGRRGAGYCVLALVIPAVLHGVNDWLNNIQTVLGGLTIAASFIFLYGYLGRIDSLIAAGRDEPGSGIAEEE